jgi:streptogramin lyase
MPESRALSSHKLQTVGIEGTLLMLDDTTPHVAVPVQAICNGEVVATTLSDESGRYRFINLEPGQYQVRCQVLDGYVYYRATDHALRFTFCDPDTTEPGMEDCSGDTLDVPRGKTLRNIDFRFAPFKKGTWRHYGPFDGLAHDTVNRIFVEPDGVMWLGTDGGGVSRYDGNRFVNFTGKDGLSSDVWDIKCDPDGVMWFGASYGGVTRYDGKEFVTFTSEDGLAGNTVHVIHRDPDGVMWFGGWRGGGISRYDGKQFVKFTVEDGLASNSIHSIRRDPDGMIWFATANGVCRYDGKQFVNFTKEDGLASDDIRAIHRNPDGVMWFGTDGGVSRYGGFSPFC